MKRTRFRTNRETSLVLAIARRGPTALLPGETAPEAALIDRAVEELNRIYTIKALETARLIGEYILETFFDGDLERFRARGRKHVSLQRLARREDLRFSPTFIWTSVAIVDQLRQLPGEMAEQLPLSHHRMLLSVKDPQAKLALAERAISQQLSKRELEREVRRRRRSRRRTPRSPAPLLESRLTRNLDQLRDVARSLLAMTDTLVQDPRTLPNPGVERFLDDLEKEIDALQELISVMRGRLPAPLRDGR